MQRIVSLIALSVFFISCSSEKEPTTPPPGSDRLEPPPAGQGVQFKMVTTIAAGQEIERCQFFVAPAEGLNINSEKIRYTPGSHHVLLYSTDYDQIPTRTTNGVELDTSGVVDCAEGATADWEVTGVVAGSQSAEGEGLVGTLPAGVAVRVPAGKVLLMNTHYLNATLSPLEADARINLYTIPDAQVQQEAGVLFYYNPFIRIPANGTSSSEMICPVWQNTTIISVQSHMHSRGVGFAASLVDTDGTKSEIYTNTHWENVPAKRYEPALQLTAGQSLQYRCEYRNVEAREVIQGGKTTDEMCMLIGPYYPRDARLENCLDQTGNFAATWIGSGTKSCADTMNCMFSATGDGPFFGCVVDSCPKASVEVTDVTRCLFSDGFGACSDACRGQGGDCQACMQNACGTMFNACAAKTCD